MAFMKKKIDPRVQEWLRQVAAQGRSLIYGETGGPEWGTRFSEIEKDGMTLGLELARLLMEQSVAQQAEQVPDAALEVAGDESTPAGTETAGLTTEAGEVTWEEPRRHLKRGRKAFFPPASSTGPEG
jgi:hypothetical protein